MDGALPSVCEKFNAKHGVEAGGKEAGLNGDATAVFIDEVFGDPEADACADVFFGGEEGIEDARQVFRRDAEAIVADGDGGGFVVANDFDFDDAAGSRKCIAGVGDDVGEDLAEIVGGQGKGEFGVAVDAYLRAARGTAGPEHVDDAFDNLDGVEGARGGFGAHEGESAAGNGGKAGEFLIGALQVRFGFGRQERIGLGEIDEVGDRLERVVDFVGDGGGEAADGGELFGADEGELGILALSDVEGDAVPDFKTGNGGVAAAFQPVNFAAGPAHAKLRLEGVAGGDGGGVFLKDAVPVFVDDETESILEGVVIGERAAEDARATHGPLQAAIVDVVHPRGGVAGLLGFSEGVSTHLQRGESGTQATAGDALAFAEPGDEKADGENDSGVNERLPAECQEAGRREDKVIEDERGEDDGEEAGRESAKKGYAGNGDEAESERRAMQCVDADGENGGEPGKGDGGDVSAKLPEKNGVAAWNRKPG